MKKTNVWKRVAALAAVVVCLSSGVTCFAATAEELREEAQKAYEAKEYEAAAELYGQIIASGEGNIADYWYAGKTQSELDNTYKAYELFDTAMGLEEIKLGQNRETILGHMMKLMFSSENYWNVEQLYMEAQAYNISTPAMNAFMGDTYKNCEMYHEAMDIYGQMLAQCAENPTMLASINYAISECYTNLHQYELAMNYVAAGNEASPDQVKYAAKMLKIYFAQGKTDIENLGIQGWSEMTSIDKATAIRNSGYVKYAVPYYAKALADGEDVDIFYMYSLQCNGQLEEAIAEGNRILANDPDNVAVLVQMGCIYCDEMGLYDQAMECFMKANDIDSTCEYALPNTLVALRKKGDFTGLVAQAKLVQNQLPREKDGYNVEINFTKDITAEEALVILSRYEDFPEDEELQGQILFDGVDLDYFTEASLESFLAYASKSSDNYYFVMAQAECLSTLGRYEESYTLYDKAVSMAGCMENKARFKRAYAYSEAKEYEKAKEDFEWIYRNNGDVTALNQLVKNYFRQGDFENAYNTILTYEEMGGDKATAFLRKLEYGVLMNDFQFVLETADLALLENANSKVFKAYKVAALEQLGMDGSEEFRTEIDLNTMTVTSTDRLLVAGLLGNYEEAIATLQVIMEHRSGVMTYVRNAYELNSLRSSKEYCELAGIEYIAPAGKTDPAADSDDSAQKGEGGASNFPLIPVAVGVCGIGLFGAMAAIAIKKK